MTGIIRNQQSTSQRSVGCILALVVLQGNTEAAPATADDLLAEIEETCSKAAAFSNKQSARVRFFAELTRTNGREFWREFPSVAALQKATRSGELSAFTQMKYWAVPEGFSYVDTFFTSESGDWSNLAEYCFRADGSLAREEATNNNISMGIRSWRVRYFDEAGRTIKTQRQVYKIDTDKPIPMSNFQAPDNPLYKQLRRVPFYRFINNDK